MKIRKYFAAGVLAGILALGSSTAALAGEWRMDSTGWWWQEDDGSYPAAAWKWIDGNHDGVEECYYFDNYGYCLLGGTAPDGYQVNTDGAWVENGVVQRRQVSGTVSQASVSRETVDGLTWWASWVYVVVGLNRGDNWESPAYDTRLFSSTMTSEDKGELLWIAQCGMSWSDPRVESIAQTSCNRIRKSDIRGIMSELFSSVSEADIRHFDRHSYVSEEDLMIYYRGGYIPIEVSSDYYYMHDGTGDFGDAWARYYLSDDNVSAVMDNGRLKITGQVMQLDGFSSGSPEPHPVKTFQAWFVPNAGSCLNGYSFDQLIVG